MARTPSGQQEVQLLLDVICSCGGAPPRRSYTSSNLEHRGIKTPKLFKRLSPILQKSVICIPDRLRKLVFLELTVSYDFLCSEAIINGILIS